MSVDLEQLKARLAKLGVHITESSHLEEHDQQRADSLVQSNTERHNRTLAQLLGRCARVQHAIQTAADADGSQRQSSGDDREDVQQEAAAETRQQKPAAGRDSNQQHSSSRRSKAAGCLHGSDARLAGKPGAIGKVGAKAAGSSANTRATGKAAAQADSKQLVRAAQRLLEDAQADAQHVSRSLKAAAGSKTCCAAPAGVPACSSSTCGLKSTPGTLAAAAVVDDLRNSPLGTVLAQYKEAQAAWAQEKAKLRREAVAARKEVAQVRLELSKVSRSSEHRAQEASCLKAALKGRDVLLEELQGRVRQLEEELARCQEVAAERLVVVSRERDDLQALLLATLERLEGVEAAVAAANATSAAMEDKVRVLETERLAALQTAATARQEVSQLQEARRRLELQSQLLEKLSKVQLQHNKRKSEALRELLAEPEAASEISVAAAGGDDTSRSYAGGSKAAAALRELLDELMSSSNSSSGTMG